MTNTRDYITISMTSTLLRARWHQLGDLLIHILPLAAKHSRTSSFFCFVSYWCKYLEDIELHSVKVEDWFDLTVAHGKRKKDLGFFRWICPDLQERWPKTSDNTVHHSAISISNHVLLSEYSVNTSLTCARNYRPSFRENKLKTLVFNDWLLAFWACFHENPGL